MASKKLFKCSFCDETFAIKNSLESHILNHSDQIKPYHCSICGDEYAFKSNLETHLLDHGPETSYEGMKCNQSFKSNLEFTNHMNVHDSSISKFECGICERKFRSVKTLTRHLTRHQKDGPCENSTSKELYFKEIACETMISKSSKESLNNHDFHVDLKKSHDLKDNLLEVNIENIPSNENVTKERLNYIDDELSPNMKDANDTSEDVDSYNMVCQICSKHFVYEKAFNSHLAKHKMEDEGKAHFTYKCNTCQNTFSVRSHYKKHVDQELYVCEACEKSFSCCKDYKNHKKSHSLDCSVCNSTFKTFSALTQHVLTHTQEKCCSVCQKKYPNAWSLHRHMRTIHFSKKHVQCDLCGKLYEKRYLKSHMITHTGERPHSCKICGRGFVQPIHLKTHMKIHTGERKHICNICGQAFALKSTLVVHTRRHTGEKPYSCGVCSKTFSSLTSLKQHKRTHFDNEKLPCKICNSRFAQNYQLYSHYQTHSKEEILPLDEELKKKIITFSMKKRGDKKVVKPKDKSLECSYCGKTFKIMANLKMHVLIHTGEKPHVCPLCGRSFRLKHSLKVHQRTHTGERPFKCNECDKRFVQFCHLKTHIITHTGEKPYSCPTCGKAFADKNNLSAHKKIHLRYPSTSFECVWCGRIFHSRKDVLYHQKNCSMFESGKSSIQSILKQTQVVYKENNSKSGSDIPSIECTATDIKVESDILCQNSHMILIKSEDISTTSDTIIHIIDEPLLDEPKHSIELIT